MYLQACDDETCDDPAEAMRVSTTTAPVRRIRGPRTRGGWTYADCLPAACSSMIVRRVAGISVCSNTRNDGLPLRAFVWWFPNR
jgi:hypothetical protein